MADWAERFVALSEYIAQWSKDPKRKVGAVIIDLDRNILATGYNGFARGIADDERLNDREIKLQMIVHAEANALCAAARNGHSLKNAAIYISRPVCSQCAAMLIQAGITSVVWRKPPSVQSRWDNNWLLSREMLVDAGVAYFEIP